MAEGAGKRAPSCIDEKIYEVPSCPSLKSIQTNTFGKLNAEQYKVVTKININYDLGMTCRAAS